MWLSSLKLTARADRPWGIANQLAVTTSTCHPTPFTYFAIIMICMSDPLLKVKWEPVYCIVLKSAAVWVLVHKQATREGTVCQKGATDNSEQQQLGECCFNLFLPVCPSQIRCRGKYITSKRLNEE